MKEVLIRGWFWLAIVLAIAGYAVSLLFGIALVTSILFMVALLVSMYVGILVTLFVPLPVPLKFIAGMLTTIVAVWFGASYLGVV
jgi:hypothetical protein